jgi:hypothetical protein
MGSRQIVLVSTAGFSVLNMGIFWQEAKTKRLFSQCTIDRKNNINQKKYYRNDTLFVCNTTKCFLTSLTISYAMTGLILLLSTMYTHFYVKTPTARID